MYHMVLTKDNIKLFVIKTHSSITLCIMHPRNLVDYIISVFTVESQFSHMHSSIASFQNYVIFALCDFVIFAFHLGDTTLQISLIN